MRHAPIKLLSVAFDVSVTFALPCITSFGACDQKVVFAENSVVRRRPFA